MVILVDGPAHGAQGIVAVGHGVGNGELFQAAGFCSLDDTHKRDVVGDKRVEPDSQFPGIRSLVVGAENGIGDCLFPRLAGGGLPLGLTGGDDLAVH